MTLDDSFDAMFPDDSPITERNERIEETFGSNELTIAVLQGDIYTLLKKLNSSIPIMMVTHDVGVISSYVDRVACLNRKLFIHESGNLTHDMLDEAYECPVEMIAHGIPHRVFEEH